MYKLINEINQEVENVDALSESINIVFDEEEAKLILEGAEHLIGKAIAALKGGNNPFERGISDPQLIAGLDVLTKSEMRDAHGVDRNKLSVIAASVDKERQANDLVRQIGKKATQRRSELMTAAQSSPEELAKHLSKLQMFYTKASGMQQSKLAA